MIYATLDQVKDAITSYGTVAYTAANDRLQLCLDAACEAIDAHCGRSFGTADGTATAKVYATAADDLVYVEDCTSVTLVETDVSLDGTWSVAWTSNDWQAEPLNSTKPYNRVRAVGSKGFPVTGRAAVRVTATYGRADLPAAVTWAAIQWTLRLFKRTETPLGYGGGPETGLLYVSRQLDGDIAELLRPHRDGVLAAGGFA